MYKGRLQNLGLGFKGLPKAAFWLFWPSEWNAERLAISGCHHISYTPATGLQKRHGIQRAWGFRISGLKVSGWGASENWRPELDPKQSLGRIFIERSLKPADSIHVASLSLDQKIEKHKRSLF